MLPEKVTNIKSVDPNRMIVASFPKTGKTSVFSELTLGGKWLLLDLENGSRFIKNMRVSLEGPNELIELGEEIKKADYPYEGLIIDSLTVLERFAKKVATDNYRNSLIGSTWAGDDIVDLPKGAGYGLLRKAFFEIIDFVQALSPKTVYLGHLKSSAIGSDEDSVNALQLDLLGKTPRILASEVDAIGFMRRNDDNETIIDFSTSDEQYAGARPEHLQGKAIKVAKKVEDNLVVDLSGIYTEKCH
tara:strand:- start:975 stop:1709 length:735 start_codon:yes stop_codon:yes gene_type:complete